MKETSKVKEIALSDLGKALYMERLAQKLSTQDKIPYTLEADSACKFAALVGVSDLEITRSYIINTFEADEKRILPYLKTIAQDNFLERTEIAQLASEFGIPLKSIYKK